MPKSTPEQNQSRRELFEDLSHQLVGADGTDLLANYADQKAADFIGTLRLCSQPFERAIGFAKRGLSPKGVYKNLPARTEMEYKVWLGLPLKDAVDRFNHPPISDDEITAYAADQDPMTRLVLLVDKKRQSRYPELHRETDYLDRLLLCYTGLITSVHSSRRAEAPTHSKDQFDLAS